VIQEDIAVFSLSSGREFAEKVCTHLGVLPAAHEEREFEDGEHKARPLVSVRGRDVFVVQSIYGDAEQSVNDKLCKLLFFIGCLRDSSARRVTAVLPYLCYSRKDRKTKPRDPITTRYVATLFEAVGAGRVVTLDVHNLAAFQNAWRIPADHLEAMQLFVQHFTPLVRDKDVVVVSPDVGGVKRAESFRQALAGALGREIQNALVEKYRSEGVVSGQTLSGDVRGKTAIIIDDMISTGTTVARAAELCRKHGAAAVYAAASHGVFGTGSNEVFQTAPIEKTVVTNTIPPFRLAENLVSEKLVVLDTSLLIAESIRRIHGERE
jgi:ribose-phosphate pyrophosphokinase